MHQLMPLPSGSRVRDEGTRRSRHTALSFSFRYTLFTFLEPTLTRFQLPRSDSRRICSSRLHLSAVFPCERKAHELEAGLTDNSVFSRLSMLLYVSTWMSDNRSAATFRWSSLVTGSFLSVSSVAEVEEVGLVEELVAVEAGV